MGWAMPPLAVKIIMICLNNALRHCMTNWSRFYMLEQFCHPFSIILDTPEVAWYGIIRPHTTLSLLPPNANESAVKLGLGICLFFVCSTALGRDKYTLSPRVSSVPFLASTNGSKSIHILAWMHARTHTRARMHARMRRVHKLHTLYNSMFWKHISKYWAVRPI